MPPLINKEIGLSLREVVLTVVSSNEKNWQPRANEGGERGVSVMVAIIVLIGISMLIAASLLTLIPEATPEKSISPSIQLQYEDADNLLTLTHQGGGDIPNAFVLENSEIAWKDLEVRKNGARISADPQDEARLNGENEMGLVTYTLGDQLKFQVKLADGDKVTVVYIPTDQVLLSFEM